MMPRPDRSQADVATNKSGAVEFWSSVELGAFTRGLLRELSTAGRPVKHRFEVAERDYRETTTASARFRLRWRSYVSYVLGLRRRLQQRDRPAVLVVCTNTFYAPAVALRAARRAGVPVVHWVFDLYPDVLVEGGTIREGGVGQRILERATRSTFDGAAANVFLGEHLLRFAVRRYGAIPRSVVIPVGADGSLFRAAPPAARPSTEPLRILYCGNFGRMHETETVAALLRDPPAPGWTLEFRGHGHGFRALAAAVAQSAGSPLVSFGESLPEAEWTASMKKADIALVTMKRGAEGLVMPSKTYSAMVAGQAILAICPSESDLAATVRAHDAGWVVEPGDVTGLKAVIAAASEDREGVLRKRLNSFHAGHRYYDEAVLAARWGELFDSLERTNPS